MKEKKNKKEYKEPSLGLHFSKTFNKVYLRKKHGDNWDLDKLDFTEEFLKTLYAFVPRGQVRILENKQKQRDIIINFPQDNDAIQKIIDFLETQKTQ